MKKILGRYPITLNDDACEYIVGQVHIVYHM